MTLRRPAGSPLSPDEQPRGHFDGLAPDRPELRGWCLDAAEVWLRAGDARAVMVPCRDPRPDLEAVGLPLFCGFAVPLELLGSPADLLGLPLGASLDAEGRRPLPQAQPWHLGAGQLLRVCRGPLLDSGNRLLRDRGPEAAIDHFAEALLDDPDHGPYHERLRYALLRLAVGTCAQSRGS